MYSTVLKEGFVQIPKGIPVGDSRGEKPRVLFNEPADE